MGKEGEDIHRGGEDQVYYYSQPATGLGAKLNILAGGAVISSPLATFVEGNVGHPLAKVFFLLVDPPVKFLIQVGQELGSFH